MPRPLRGAGPIGIALTAVDLWRRLPPRHRRMLLGHARTHGPRLLARAVRGRRR